MNKIDNKELLEKDYKTLFEIVSPHVWVDENWNHLINQFWADESLWSLPQIVLVDSTRQKIPNEEEIKQAEYEKLKSSPSFYNGRNIRLEWIEMIDWKPVLIASEIDYLTNRILGTKPAVSQVLKNIWPEALGAGLSVSTILVTVDWKYIFWEKQLPTQVQQDFIGWVVEVPKNFQYQKYQNLDDKKVVNWLEYTIAREIMEEVGLKFQRIWIDQIKYLWMVGWAFGRFNISTLVPIHLSFSELEKRFWQMWEEYHQKKQQYEQKKASWVDMSKEKEPIAPELSKLIWLSKQEYIDYLKTKTVPKQMIAEKLSKL